MKKITQVLPLVMAVILPLLFHRQQAGLNLLLFDLIIVGLLLYTRRLRLNILLHSLLASGVLLSGIMVLMYGSNNSAAANIVSLVLLGGLISTPELSVLMNAVYAAFVSVITGPVNYFRSFKNVASNRWVKPWLKFGGFVILPAIAIILFISLYSSASIYFNELTGSFMDMLNDMFSWVFKLISPSIFWLGVAGLFIGLSFFFGKSSIPGDLLGENGGDNLMRVRKFYSGSMIGLKTEARIAVLMFASLNIVLLVMNLLDIYHVWLYFEWDGGFLKQFVHEGTWLLILSIVISMALVTWYFRGNLNFYPGGRLLRLLALIWLAQNMVLAVSVGVRNYWYMHYFNLAFKRIWVFAFLVLVVIGLVTVMIKVMNIKSMRYLLTRNSVYAYVVFVGLSLFNWDQIIASFNTSRSQKAFFHTNFMVDLNNSSLPMLLMNETELESVNTAQYEMFPYYNNYMQLEVYDKKVRERCEEFLQAYPRTHWLEWNLADDKAHKKLRQAQF